MSCTKIGEFCKTPAERVLLRIPLKGGSFIKYFSANEILAPGDVRRPKRENGYEYTASIGGQCDRSEPEWPTEIGLAVQSGSVIFTCSAISNSSLARVVQSVLWLPDTLTISNDAIVNSGGEQEVFAYALGGTTGDKGEVTARIAFSDGSIEDATLSYHVD